MYRNPRDRRIDSHLRDLSNDPEWQKKDKEIQHMKDEVLERNARMLKEYEKRVDFLFESCGDEREPSMEVYNALKQKIYGTKKFQNPPEKFTKGSYAELNSGNFSYSLGEPAKSTDPGALYGEYDTPSIIEHPEYMGPERFISLDRIAPEVKMILSEITPDISSDDAVVVSPGFIFNQIPRTSHRSTNEAHQEYGQGYMHMAMNPPFYNVSFVTRGDSPETSHFNYSVADNPLLVGELSNAMVNAWMDGMFRVSEIEHEMILSQDYQFADSLLSFITQIYDDAEAKWQKGETVDLLLSDVLHASASVIDIEPAFLIPHIERLIQTPRFDSKAHPVRFVRESIFEDYTLV